MQLGYFILASIWMRGAAIRLGSIHEDTQVSGNTVCKKPVGTEQIFKGNPPGEYETEEDVVKATYISWTPALKLRLDEITTGFYKDRKLEIDEKIEADDVAIDGDAWIPENFIGRIKKDEDFSSKLQDVGASRIDKFRDALAVKIQAGEPEPERNPPCDLLKVDVEKEEIGLITGGTYETRKTSAEELNGLCSRESDSFFAFHPADETKYTMEAAVPAWHRVWENNKEIFGYTPCQVVVLMVGSSDLHAGIISNTEIEKMFTMVDYGNKTGQSVCYTRNGVEKSFDEPDVAECFEEITQAIEDIGITVVGGKTVFMLDEECDQTYLSQRDLTTKSGNMFVLLDDTALKCSKLPHKKVEDDLKVTGTVLLAMRGR